MNTPKLSRRSFLKSAGLVTGTVLLAACGGKAAEPTAAPAAPSGGAAPAATTAPAAKTPVTLSCNTQYWDPQAWPKSAAEYKSLLAQTFPWITVQYQASDATTLETRMAAGDAPDILFVYPELAIPWAARKQLIPLTDAINADSEWKKDVDACIKSMNDGYTWKGNLYGATIAAEAECYSYNPKQFEKKGVETPDKIGLDKWTIDKFVETVKAITDGPNDKALSDKPCKGGWASDPSAYNSGFGDILYANGGKYFSEDGKKALLNSAPVLQTAQMYVDMVKGGWGLNSIESTAQGEWVCLALANQHTASVIAGDWCWGWAHKTQLERKEFEPGMFYVPAGPNGRHPLAHSAGESLFAKTKNKDAAMTYIKWVFTKPYQEATAKWYEEAPRYPARHDAAGAILDKKLLPDFFPKLFDDSWASPATPMINFMGILGYWGDTMKAVFNGSDTRPLQTVLDELNSRTQKDMDASGAGLDI